jgi:drug/metabolite transporter (DMT)-like permease
MIYLLITTLIWGFSFTLIGSALGGVNPLLVASLRLGIGCLCFFPLLKPHTITTSQRTRLMLIGAVQFGAMYVPYLSAYHFAPAYVVALFSSFTPLWISAIAAVRIRTSCLTLLASGVLATAGALIIRAGQPIEEGESILMAFLLMQLANICFGAGQLAYRQWAKQHPDLKEKDSFVWMYVGGFLFTLLFLLPRLALGQTLPALSLKQMTVILYLGVVASGLGFYFWNLGSSRVSTGVLAAANNLVVPLGVILALIFSQKTPNWVLLPLGSAAIALALYIAPREAERNA